MGDNDVSRNISNLYNMDTPIKKGVYSHKEAVEILGECSLGKKVSSEEEYLQHQNFGWAQQDVWTTRPVYSKAWISLVDSSMFVWAE